VPSLDDPAVIDKLGPGFALFFLALGAGLVTKSFWQLTGHRNYFWFVGPAIVVSYALLFALYLRKPCAGMQLKHFLIVQVMAIGMVWGWLDAAFRVINCGLDRSTPSDLVAQVVGADRRKGAYLLTLSAGPAFDSVELNVGADAYRRAHIGGSIVVTWHKGALREGWCGRRPVRIEAPSAMR
jgi:hypothetical protein